MTRIQKSGEVTLVVIMVVLTSFKFKLVICSTDTTHGTYRLTVPYVLQNSESC